MAFRGTGGWEGWHKGPAAVERVLCVEVRITGEDLAFAIAEQLFRQEAFRQQLRDIRFDDLARVFFPVGDLRAADERALRAGDREIGIGGFEGERREQFGGACGEDQRRGRGVAGLTSGTNLLQRLRRFERVRDTNL
jgi:hypothetical protein